MKTYKIICNRGYRKDTTETEGILNLFDHLDFLKEREQELRPTFEDFGCDLRFDITITLI